MKYQGNQFVSAKFLKENNLITNESIFFKCVPQRYKLKVVESKLFDEIKYFKEKVELVQEVEMEVPSWVVPASDVTFETILNFEEPSTGFEYLDFISMDFYKSMKWVGYSKRTKLGEQQ